MASFLRPSRQIKNTFESQSYSASMSYACLHLDAKTAIAITSIAAWNALMRADPSFGRYALTDAGRSMFLSTFTVIEDGEWTVGGKFHRIGGPARVCDDGSEAWYEHGKPHRVDGPAHTSTDYGMEWYERGQLHRIGGPAAIYDDGGNAWYERGKLHRIGGPARTYADGGNAWYEHGKPHRIGGPARTTADGCEIWYDKGKLHRVGGPAITYADGNGLRSGRCKYRQQPRSS